MPPREIERRLAVDVLDARVRPCEDEKAHTQDIVARHSAMQRGGADGVNHERDHFIFPARRTEAPMEVVEEVAKHVGPACAPDGRGAHQVERGEGRLIVQEFCEHVSVAPVRCCVQGRVPDELDACTRGADAAELHQRVELAEDGAGKHGRVVEGRVPIRAVHVIIEEAGHAACEIGQSFAIAPHGSLVEHRVARVGGEAQRIGAVLEEKLDHLPAVHVPPARLRGRGEERVAAEVAQLGALVDACDGVRVRAKGEELARNLHVVAHDGVPQGVVALEVIQGALEPVRLLELGPGGLAREEVAPHRLVGGAQVEALEEVGSHGPCPAVHEEVACSEERLHAVLEHPHQHRHEAAAVGRDGKVSQSHGAVEAVVVGAEAHVVGVRGRGPWPQAGTSPAPSSSSSRTPRSPCPRVPRWARARRCA
mmetsp:Transcript_3590/g.10531  ORF Transcript_3590/g.10531 Transcript_3590/m.10531 type:complete len:423 (+) Transcript_3590:823-2091(+)